MYNPACHHCIKTIINIMYSYRISLSSLHGNHAPQNQDILKRNVEISATINIVRPTHAMQALGVKNVGSGAL